MTKSTNLIAILSVTALAVFFICSFLFIHHHNEKYDARSLHPFTFTGLDFNHDGVPDLVIEAYIGPVPGAATSFTRAPTPYDVKIYKEKGKKRI